MTARPREDPPGRIGFLETLVALALVGVVALVSLPWLFATLNRARLTRSARETREMVELARLQARKLGLRTHVVWDGERRRMTAFVDVDLDGRFDPAHDYPAGPAFPLPEPIEVRGPGDASPLGSHAIVGFEPPVDGAAAGAVFLADGAAHRPGAFRFADPRGNFLEVRVPGPAGERAEIRKWSGGSDVDAAWVAVGEDERPWRWE
jgi:type II secretory pathway pseudopilin PulG